MYHHCPISHVWNRLFPNRKTSHGHWTLNNPCVADTSHSSKPSGIPVFATQLSRSLRDPGSELILDFVSKAFELPLLVRFPSGMMVETFLSTMVWPPSPSCSWQCLLTIGSPGLTAGTSIASARTWRCCCGGGRACAGRATRWAPSPSAPPQLSNARLGLPPPWSQKPLITKTQHSGNKKGALNRNFAKSLFRNSDRFSRKFSRTIYIYD